LVKSKKVDIFNYKIIGMEYILGSDLFNQVSQNINDLGENEYKTFNAKKILDEWELYFKKCKKEYPVFEIEMEVSSGTYIRSICSDIGIMLGIGALAFEIERINVNLET
jgi:tRNA U55 pseudouridine synthase TruB